CLGPPARRSGHPRDYAGDWRGAARPRPGRRPPGAPAPPAPAAGPRRPARAGGAADEPGAPPHPPQPPHPPAPRPARPRAQPLAAVLWPEPFDLGITAGAINYGASPGDAQVADPYLYVGPHDGPPPGDRVFWNAPFGAVRTIDQIAPRLTRPPSSATAGRGS